MNAMEYLSTSSLAEEMDVLASELVLKQAEMLARELSGGNG